MYVIINLIDRVVEIHHRPLVGERRFAESFERATGESVEFPTAAGEKIVVPVEDLLAR